MFLEAKKTCHLAIMHIDHLRFTTHTQHTVWMLWCHTCALKRTSSLNKTLFFKLNYILKLFCQLIFHQLDYNVSNSSKNQEMKGFTHCTPPTQQQHMGQCLAHREESICVFRGAVKGALSGESRTKCHANQEEENFFCVKNKKHVVCCCTKLNCIYDCFIVTQTVV